jgi:hypothetical protein
MSDAGETLLSTFEKVPICTWTGVSMLTIAAAH